MNKLEKRRESPNGQAKALVIKNDLKKKKNPGVRNLQHRCGTNRNVYVSAPDTTRNEG